MCAIVLVKGREIHREEQRERERGRVSEIEIILSLVEYDMDKIYYSFHMHSHAHTYYTHSDISTVVEHAQKRGNNEIIIFSSHFTHY